MPTHQQKLRRGNSAQIGAFTPADGEVVVNTETGRLHLGDGSTLGGIPHARLDDISSGFDPGDIKITARSSPETGWLFCDGSAISRSTYADLFSAIGTTYGSGNGTTTFNIPDLRGRVVAGQDDMGGTSANRLTSPLNGDTLGATGGAESHALTNSEIPANSLTTDGGPPPTGDPQIDQDFVKASAHTGTGSAHPNVQPTIILNYVIKT